MTLKTAQELRDFQATYKSAEVETFLAEIEIAIDQALNTGKQCTYMYPGDAAIVRQVIPILEGLGYHCFAGESKDENYLCVDWSH
jgi:hypothetical protein